MSRRPSPNRMLDLHQRIVDRARTELGEERIAEILQRAREAMPPERQPSWRSELAAQRLRQVRQLSLEGAPVEKIASELSISTRHVVQLRAQLGVNRHTLAGFTKARIRELSEIGTPVQDIARQLGLSRVYVSQVRSRLGLCKPRKRR
jgi:AraC-like DNA-binding protein